MDNITKEDFQKLREKYPNRFPVIVEKNKKCQNLQDIDKKKFLVPEDLTVGQFVYIIRKRIKLEPSEALYLYCNNTLPSTSVLMSSVCSHDDFAYFTYSKENTFG